MNLVGAISLFCLVATGTIATWGIFSKHFDDSLLQRIGLSTVAVACFLRVPIKIENPDTPPELLAAQIGLVIYAIGTALKLCQQTGGRRVDRRGRRGHSLS